MLERIDAGREHIRIVLDDNRRSRTRSAPGSVSGAERLAAFARAEGEEMRQRIDMRGRDVRIGLQILLRIEVEPRSSRFCCQPV